MRGPKKRHLPRLVGDLEPKPAYYTCKEIFGIQRCCVPKVIRFVIDAYST